MAGALSFFPVVYCLCILILIAEDGHQNAMVKDTIGFAVYSWEEFVPFMAFLFS